MAKKVVLFCKSNGKPPKDFLSTSYFQIIIDLQAVANIVQRVLYTFTQFSPCYIYIVTV